MKKIFAFCAAAAMFAACAKEVAQTPVDEFKTPVDGNALVPVELTSNVTASVVTKGQGALDAWDGTQPLYIYGYQRAQSINYSDLSLPLIANLKTTAPGSGVGPDSIEILDGNRKPYYYIINNTYDFYGYYIDNLNSIPDYRNDGVYGNSEAPNIKSNSYKDYEVDCGDYDIWFYMIADGYWYYTEIEDVYIHYNSTEEVYVEDGNWKLLVPSKASSMYDKLPEVVKVSF